MNKQYIKELAALSLFTVSWLWLLGTAGASDMDNISLGQCALQIAIGVIGLGASAIWMNNLSREEVADGEDNQN